MKALSILGMHATSSYPTSLPQLILVTEVLVLSLLILERDDLILWSVFPKFLLALHLILFLLLLIPHLNFLIQGHYPADVILFKYRSQRSWRAPTAIIFCSGKYWPVMTVSKYSDTARLFYLIEGVLLLSLDRVSHGSRSATVSVTLVKFFLRRADLKSMGIQKLVFSVAWRWLVFLLCKFVFLWSLPSFFVFFRINIGFYNF